MFSRDLKICFTSEPQVGSAPAIVLCTLKDAQTCCHGTAPSAASARVQAAWSNYHCLVEAAKHVSEAQIADRTGCQNHLQHNSHELALRMS